MMESHDKRLWLALFQQVFLPQHNGALFRLIQNNDQEMDLYYLVCWAISSSLNFSGVADLARSRSTNSGGMYQ